MGQIARLATFVIALLFVVLSFVLPWFSIDYEGGLDVELNPIPFRGSSGLVVVLCDACPEVYTGRLPGGLAWLAAHIALQFCVALVASGYQVLKGYRSPAITTWTALSAIALGLITLLVLWSFGPPRGLDVGVSSRFGLWSALVAGALAVIGHSRLLDRFDSLVAGPVEPSEPTEPARPAALRDVRGPATHVRSGDAGHAGMRVTTDLGERRFTWADVQKILLVTTVEPAVEITLRDAVLRITRKSAVDYRYLPGATDGTDLDNLRRLYNVAREQNPALTRVS